MLLSETTRVAILLLTVVANLLLTVAVYRRDKKDALGVIFALLGIVSSIWLVLMYLSFHPFLLRYSVFLIRATIFTAAPMSFLFFFLGYNISHQNLPFPRNLFRFSLISTLLVMSLAFTPFIFKQVEVVNGLPQPIAGPGMILFAALTTFFSIGAIYTLLRRWQSSTGIERQQFSFVITGIALMVGFIITTILIPVVFFHNNFFVPFAPIYAFLFLAMTAVAILKYHLFDLKIIATEALVTVLMMILLFEGMFSSSLYNIIFKTFFAILVGILGSVLVRSVRKEVEQREELSRLAKSLEQANLRLQELDRQKTDFLSIAAHQLRTPLSIINGYTELIKDGAYGKVSSAVKDILHNIDESNSHLIKLVDEFLNITRIEQGRTKYEFKDVDINTVIDSVYKELHVRAKQHDLKLVWKPEKDLPKIFIDDEKIRHVIFNFIDNAIKYSTKGSVTVTALSETGGISVRVRDKGFGFNKIDEANFFQKFYRGENVKGTNVNGTGLGLYVCRMFIAGHKGSIWGHSEGLGKGSEFGFWIPLKPDSLILQGTTNSGILS